MTSPNFATEPLDVWLLENCVCPVDHCELVREGNYLVSTRNPLRRYPIAYGIPVFLRDDDESTAWWALESLKRARNIADGKVDTEYYDPGSEGVHAHVHGVIESTGGHLYEELKGRMVEYPIPQIRVDRPAVPSPLLLDGGCNWGRWTFSAARKGIPAIGVDPSLGAVIAARQIRRQLNLPCSFFVGDVRFLPFREGTFTNVFSYSVVQHFSKENARLAFGEFSRILQNRGECFVQMPNALGIRCLYHLARRRFHEGRNFDVRYYTLPELKRLLSGLFQVVELSLDAYLGLGIQPDDRKYMSWRNRLVIDVSEKLRVLQHLIPPLLYFADSIYVYGRKNV